MSALVYTQRVAVQGMEKWGDVIPQSVKTAILLTAEAMLASAQEIVPVDTGALKNSGHTLEEDHSGDSHKYSVIVGFGGPTAPYAGIVHESPQYKHASPTSWKYLEIPFNIYANDASNRITALAKTIAGAGDS